MFKYFRAEDDVETAWRVPLGSVADNVDAGTLDEVDDRVPGGVREQGTASAVDVAAADVEDVHGRVGRELPNPIEHRRMHDVT